ncbi:hypothetical protein [Nocardioides sp. Leaf285]|uniref:hypothetical protein n=1 Tax=Nocardioides sp. Leaf285 TaxID=1736322 RepID=UPI00070383B2|nr:hypothetical protein [Nocardioides sp. Leaf285]KQP63525.1 hypothetical protein ASF47_15825 [Nocardioides sp. Leaf285]
MKPLAWWLASTALVLAGVVLLLTTQADPTGDGWFAYAPLDPQADWVMGWDDTVSADATYLSTWQLVGLGLAALGLVLLAARAGYARGRRAGAAQR